MALRSLLALLAVSILALAPAAMAQAPAATTPADVPTTTSAVQPRKVGDKAPDASVRDLQGRTVQLADIYSSAPTVLIFYRGGWCPYCTRQLGRIAAIEDDLKEAGLQVVAISPDAPEHLAETMKKGKLGYMVYSDSDIEASRAFGLAFRVDDETVERYKGYKIDLVERAGGKTHQVLPVPGVFVIDTGGTIRYAYANPDYKERADEKELLDAARLVARTHPR